MPDSQKPKPDENEMTTSTNESYNSKGDGKGLVKNKRLCIISNYNTHRNPFE